MVEKFSLGEPGDGKARENDTRALLACFAAHTDLAANTPQLLEELGMIEWSRDIFNIQIVKIILSSFEKNPDGWKMKDEPQLQWGPEILQLAHLLTERIGQAQKYKTADLIKLGWLFTSGLAGGTSAVIGAVAKTLPEALKLVREKLDPTNWDLDATPNLVSLFGQALWSRLKTLDPDSFAKAVTQPIGALGFTKEVATDLAEAMSNAVQQRSGFQVSFSPESILQMTPLAFVDMLISYRLARPTRNLESGAQ